MRLLLVEDDADQRQLLSELLTDFELTAAGSVAEAEPWLPKVDLVLSDWKLGDGDGLMLLRKIQRLPNAPAFVMMTAYGTISHAVEAMRQGADDYLSKPFSRQELALTLEKVSRAQRLKHDNRKLSQALTDQNRLTDIIGGSPAMQRVQARLAKVGDTDATVLIEGESGTGKELAARALHRLSKRCDKAFVAVNCGAIPEQLAESELFGTDKGAFTGAAQARAGKFEAANGGTLFLDEIGELPLLLQSKLLRVLQEGKVTRLGEHHERQLDVRIIAATNKDLKAEVQAGRFREDLYYRLNVVPVLLPPLRERKDDIPALSRHFLGLYARRHGQAEPPLTHPLLAKLQSHHWPGNVRELANRMERLVLLGEDSPMAPLAGGNGDFAFSLPPGGLDWEAFERHCLEKALALNGGNRRQTARYLGLGYKALLYRLEKYDIE
ncbi:sigma-54 dependent transcriptional regulator [Gallaecimonas kandeliae]|uniref:sigma-54-dependent transcriptional regulator n=1 Tax=Gallaecimonas kandeliae TaxID=3029055 RepID=UPI0026470264|nr:sigma-54 dependent transcriptional regulator [Gallaecimonas kandeliae]WKE64322.1 sigma-54 dependent transcriptional regulator [Gallaecimonas kandeliae]